MLTPKQQHIIDRANDVFTIAKVEQFIAPIERKLKATPEIELMPDFTDGQVADLLNDVIYNTEDNNLFTKFITPPFSVIDTKNGKWLDRRRILDEYFGDSLVGRKEALAYGELQVRANDNGTSKFDSALCELLLKWFTPKVKVCPKCKKVK